MDSANKDSIQGDDELKSQQGTPNASQSNIPKPPPRKSIRITSEQDLEKSFECGYDSDGEQGPFFDAVIDKGSLEKDEEDIPELGELATEEPTNEMNNGGIIADGPKLTPEIIRKMKLTEIKEALRKRGVKLKLG